MKSRLAAPLLIALAALTSAPALAAKLPPIKAGSKNTVPECVTPGRMQAFLKARNAQLDARYEAVAIEYMRHGEELGLRWDYAYYQMIIETGALSYRNGTRPGDVKPKQNNFAGLGATGKGEPGESFKDIASGIRAHLQHLQMYAGERVAEPVAERTRKVQEWGVLTAWHANFRQPITFTDLAQKWAPGTRTYASMIEAVAEQFNDDFCNKPDPRPDLVQVARGKATLLQTTIADAKGFLERTFKPDMGKPDIGKPDTANRDETADRAKGAEFYRRSLEDARAEGNTARAALGASALARKDGITQPTTIINPPAAETSDQATVQIAAAAGASATRSLTPPTSAAASKCRVFTASYGGQKSVIIKATAPDATNYTVLDVNEGAEKRETEAFIDAYAKGGQLMGEFASPNQALDKAFELCPES